MADVGLVEDLLSATLAGLRDYAQSGERAPRGEAIEAFWRNYAHRRAAAWLEHRDINEVMLATNLAPEGFLTRL